MKECKATPGPWQWYTSNGYLSLGIKDGYKEIMYGIKYIDGVSGIEVPHQPDANLIESAPDLLEALEKTCQCLIDIYDDMECLVDISDDSGGWDVEGVVRDSDTAIKKAKGEQS